MKKREAFNFYRSYYDVLEDINRDEDKLTYLLALLDKQFKGIEPTLEGIPKLVYNGQKHSIDKQVEGWENKTGISLNTTQDPTEPPYLHPTEDPYLPPTEDPYHHPSNDSVMTTEGGTEGGTEDPYLQEQEKEKGKEQEQEQEQHKINFSSSDFGKLNHKKKYEYLKLLKSGIPIIVEGERITIKDFCLIQEIPYDDEEYELDKQMGSIFN